jgi:hypothetical protein
MSTRRTLPGRAAPKERTKSEPCCGRCGFRTRLVPNPYYGAGLAVHRYLRVCRRCPWTVIVRENPLPAPTADAAVVPTAPEEKTADRPVRRLGFRWSHREAS